MKVKILIVCVCLLSTVGLYAQGGLFGQQESEVPSTTISSLFGGGESEQLPEFSLRSDGPPPPPSSLLPPPGEGDFVGAPVADGYWVVAICMACYGIALLRNRKKWHMVNGNE